MGIFLNRLWATLTMLVNGVHRFAAAFDHIGRVAELQSKGYADEVELENADRINELQTQLKEKHNKLIEPSTTAAD